MVRNDCASQRVVSIMCVFCVVFVLFCFVWVKMERETQQSLEGAKASVLHTCVQRTWAEAEHVQTKNSTLQHITTGFTSSTLTTVGVIWIIKSSLSLIFQRKMLPQRNWMWSEEHWQLQGWLQKSSLELCVCSRERDLSCPAILPLCGNKGPVEGACLWLSSKWQVARSVRLSSPHFIPNSTTSGGTFKSAYCK